MKPRARTGLLLALLTACSGGAPSPSPTPVASAPTTAAGLALPQSPGTLAPALTEVEAPAQISGADLADVERCAPCHQEIVSEWRTSAHAFASFNNPIYRAAVERLRSERSSTESRMCAGCHDPALLIDGAMDSDVDLGDPRAGVGVTCATCHGAVAASTDGNGSYVLSGVPLVVPASNESAAERARHVASVGRAALRTVELCASCHRAFLEPSTGNAHFLAGADDFGPWARSAYAGSDGERVDLEVEERDCRGCHMPRVEAQLPDVVARNGRVASHYFVGAHTWLAAMRNDPSALARVRAFLADSIRVDVVAVRAEHVTLLPLQRAELSPGARVLIDVVLENRSVGHHFPGGTRDIQDTRLELELRDALGNSLASSGPDAHPLRAEMLDGDGRGVGAHATAEFQSVAFDTTIPPRDARLVRFAFDVPKTWSSARGLRVSAVLRHRSRDTAIQSAACRLHERSPVGSLDPCRPQPATVVARADVDLGSEPSAEGRARRLLAYGRALSGDLLEQMDAARAPLEAARAEAERTHDTATRAAALVELARVAARQDRPDDALATLERAERWLPSHPAVARVEASALSRVWRFGDAIAPARRAAEASPRDDSAWTALAVALGSVGEDPAAFAAARRGLESAPRSEALLRAQALAARRLRLPGASEALEAYLDHREADVAPVQRRRCETATPGCALEKLPVHVHELR